MVLLTSYYINKKKKKLLTNHGAHSLSSSRHSSGSMRDYALHDILPTKHKQIQAPYFEKSVLIVFY